MKKTLSFLFAFALVLMVAGCKNGGKQAKPADFNPQSFLFTEEKLPQSLDLDMDISGLTMQELNVLRDYPYALKGMWFVDNVSNAFYTTRADWYADLCYSYLTEENDYQALTEYSQVQLSPEEEAFVKKVDARIEELKKNDFVTVDGLKLANAANTVNMFQMSEFDNDFYKALAERNFALVPTKDQQLFNTYENNAYQLFPSYVTTDLFLQAYHMYFEYVLKTLEKSVFMPRIHRLNEAMYNKAMSLASSTSNAEIKDLAEFNAAFYAVSDKLLMDNDLPVPESYRKEAEMEIENIMGMAASLSPMMLRGIEFQYDLFKPRGHYTRSEEQQRYFRSMMWIQTFIFCRESTPALQQAGLMACLFNSIDPAIRKDALGVYKTLDFLMGEPDNVAILDIAEFLAKKNVKPENLTDQAVLAQIDEYAREVQKTRDRIGSKVGEEGCSTKINFMPQRYMPDSYILGLCFDEKPNSDVPFPRGLDVFAAFGNKTADYILENEYQDSKKWSGYTEQMDAFKKEFSEFKDWDKSMYNKWFECLVQLQNTDKNYPDYMKTDAWSRKNLNTSLASWAELKHDSILYGEQPICAECGGGEELPEPDLVGYVEPNLKFWEKMLEMLDHTVALLNENKLMTEDIDIATESLRNLVVLCKNASVKEIAGETLSAEEYEELRCIGSSMEWFTLRTLAPDMYLSSWAEVQGADRSVAVVADVFTRIVLGCEKCGILFEAVGNPDAIYVIVNIGGKNYLTRGAVFSYYEFVNPLDNRYTDEEWQEKLEKDDAPGRPDWIKPLILGNAPEVNEEYFYSTGC